MYSELYLTNNPNDTNLNAVIDVNNEYTIEKIGRKFKSLSGGDVDKIKLSYLAYYYAMRPFKKVKNNVKTITEIFIKAELL